MRAHRWQFVLLFVAACAKREDKGTPAAPLHAEVTVVQADTPSTPSDPVAVASRWLDAVRDADLNSLSTSTLVPFELDDENGKCGPHQRASSPEQVGRVLSCLSGDANLIDVLRAHDEVTVEVLPTVHHTAWAKKWRVQATPTMQIVTAFFGRKDARINIDLWVEGQGIRGAWKTGLNGLRERQIAAEWLAALAVRDFERLAQATSYPFEVRDQRREALCGKRSAAGPNALKAAVDCLLRGDLLHRALVDSPSPGFTASEPTDSVPNWIEPWWRGKEHVGLQRVSTMVATLEGYEFDFQMLVARDGGVRTVWKSGSFESRE